MKLLSRWTTIIPILAWALLLSGLASANGYMQLLASVLLILSVMSSVHHSEVIAHRVGEPYGTIVLAVSITIIEVSIIVSLMLSGGEEAVSLARDTVYSATMLILNGIIGLCLFIGGLKYHEQSFSKSSATIALVSLVAIIMLTLVIPTFSSSKEGPFYSKEQMIFVAFACLVIYGFFIFAQTVRHRDYFLNGDDPVIQDDQEEELHAQPKKKGSNWALLKSLAFLLVSLGIVVLLAKALSPKIESIVLGYNLPKALVGVIIAAVILLPEGIAAVIAARKDHLQSSLNLALGSALASIGLTIPTLAIISNIYEMNIILGLDIKSILLLGLSVFIVMLSLASGRTNVVYGVVLLMNLLAFIFFTIYP